MQTVPIHRLQQLLDEDCWKLFAKHAFEEGDCGAHPNLERIGKQIVKKCKGLPLAAKTLADYEFEMERLVLMWMTEGFVEQPRTQAVSGDFCYMLEDDNTHHISERLTTLPVNLRKLIQLRHLDITGTNLQEMPMQMSQLKGLQLLTAFVVGKSKGLGIEELKEFRHLQRRLSISSL
ncbi:hypothetical protein ACSBR2_042477 [Camellia fascicularis]